MNMNEIITGVAFTERRTFAADTETKKLGEFKTVNITISYDGLKLSDVFAKAFDHDVIAWQTSARKRYESFTNGENVRISAKSPGRRASDPVTDIVGLASAAGMTVEEYVRAEMAKRGLTK